MELVLKNVGKCYADRWALRQITLTLRPGLIGLLGPNGAGKSSLMRILASVTAASEGSVSWNGTDLNDRPDALRQVLGYLPQDFGVYPNLTAVEFLEYIAAAKGVYGRTARKRIDELLELVNLTAAAGRPLKGYSGGMRQRVGIAQALLNDPQVLIVDEPTVGLDPEERMRIRQLLSELATNRIVLLSTHIVPDVEAVATQIAILARGALLTCATPEELLREVDGRTWEWLVRADTLPEIRSRYLLSSVTSRPDGVQVRAIADQVNEPGVSPVPPTLEDAYLLFTGQRRESVSAS